jgi:hypothetical protein
MMKKSWLGLGIVVVGVGLLSSHGALAGWKVTTPVTVDNANKRFYGALGSARNSTDGIQDIGCATDHIDGYCSAENSAGTSVYCFSSDPEIMAVMRSIETDSYIYVTHDGAGTCTRVSIAAKSYYAPKNP